MRRIRENRGEDEKGEFRRYQRRNGDEPGSDSSPFCCFSNGSTLLLIHSGGTAVSGVHPVERVPQVSFLTILSIVGAEGWAINRDSGLICRRPLELLNPHDRNFQGR